MNREWVSKYCMSLPHVTEQVQWQIDLVFKIGGKMFAIVVLEPHATCLALNSRPRLVGDSRAATRAGSCCTLSGISQLCSWLLKVAK